MARTKRINLTALETPNSAIRDAALTYLPDLPAYMRADNDNGVVSDPMRSDANETAMLSNALTQAAVEAIAADYPEIKFPDVAPLQDGIDPGADQFQWEEYNTVGMAKIIVSGSDDIPNVSQYVTPNTGYVQTYAIAYSYTDQDVRRAVFARRNGRQAIVLSPDKAIEAREAAMRTLDKDAAFGVSAFNIPGFFRNANISPVQASAPASGSDRSWRGVDKTGAEILKDLRKGLYNVATGSKGAMVADTIVMSIEMAEAIASKPLLAAGDNQVTVLEQFLKSQRDMGRPITIIAWNRALTADAAGTGDRVVFYKRAKQVLARVEPMLFRAGPPERRGLATHVANEMRFGGIFWKKPLGGCYMDFV